MPENFEMQADFSIFVRMDNGEIIIYRTADGETRLEVRMESDSVWLTQAQMAELFQTTPQNITMHTNHVFREGELEKEATCKRSLQVRQEGTRTIRRIQNIYNLDVIISVGYRVKSPRGTQFRIWANKVLKEYAAPCGVCRQVMMEFCDPDTFQIILATSKDQYEIFTLKELLPLGFGPNNLK